MRHTSSLLQIDQKINDTSSNFVSLLLYYCDNWSFTRQKHFKSFFSNRKMTTKWLKPGQWLKPNNGKFLNIIKDSVYKQKNITFSVSKLCVETEEAHLESHSNSDLKTNPDHKKQVSKKATVKTPLY